MNKDFSSGVIYYTPPCEDWRNVLFLGVKQHLKKGFVLASTHNEEPLLYFLDQGIIHAVLNTEDGSPHILFCAHAGSLVGDIPFFDNRLPQGILMAAKECVVYSFSYSIIMKKILPSYPTLYVSLLKYQSLKLRMLSNQIMDISQNELITRTCRYFYALVLSQNKIEGEAINPFLSQTDLSNLFGVNRVSLSKVIHELYQRKIIGKYSKYSVQILDIEQLKKLIC